MSESILLDVAQFLRHVMLLSIANLIFAFLSVIRPIIRIFFRPLALRLRFDKETSDLAMYISIGRLVYLSFV